MRALPLAAAVLAYCELQALFRSAVCAETQHDAMKLDPVAWDSLRYDGIQHDGFGGTLEQRTCSCGSTVLKRLTRGRAAVGGGRG